MKEPPIPGWSNWPSGIKAVDVALTVRLEERKPRPLRVGFRSNVNQVALLAVWVILPLVAVLTQDTFAALLFDMNLANSVLVADADPAKAAKLTAPSVKSAIFEVVFMEAFLTTVVPVA